ncbi:hypothetical protein O6H91_09G110200 [Diphasiastrum complanatum]|nr:hypothetical protein O6H91_09G110200 [Diphasiastrum complanatum]
MLALLRVAPPAAHLLSWPLFPKLPAAPSTCNGSLVYVYNLPTQFNSDLIKNCSTINPWVSICPSLSNAGMGVALKDPPWPPSEAWYATDQFATEVIFHNRLQRYPCTTDDPELATAFFVPFYAGLAVFRHLFVPDAVQQRDELSNQLLEWLSRQYYWRRNGGWDHFFVIGRITWDFRRLDDTGWGSSFLQLQAMQNTTRLLIERSPWDDQDIGIPYPTSFHPRQDEDVRQWQDYVRNRTRSNLFGYAGGPRKQFSNDFRQILLQQCDESGSCKALDCSNGKCDHPKPVMDLFLDSTFCLQPRGDSFTRRSTFDALLAGCIPVFFWTQSAYIQYYWHLPADPSSYSIFISKDAIKNGTSIKQVLLDLPEDKLTAMQSTVAELIPSIIYANPQSSFTKTADAFDLAIKGVVNRVTARLYPST